MKQSWILLIASICITQLPLVSQTSDWERMQGLAKGERLQIMIEGGETVTGKLEQASATDLTVKCEGGDTQLARWAVRRVWRVEKRSRLKRIGLGALIGFAGGCTVGAAGAGYLTDMNNPPAGTRARACFGMGAVTGGIGAGIGAAVPSTKRILLYRALEE